MICRRVYHDFFFGTRIQINISWCGSGSGQMIRIRNTGYDRRLQLLNLIARTDNCNCWPELLWRTTAIVFTWIIINWSNVLLTTAIFTTSSSITNNCNCYDQIKYYQQLQLLWPHPVLPIISIVMPWSKIFFWAALALRSQKNTRLWLPRPADNCNYYDRWLWLLWPELTWLWGKFLWLTTAIVMTDNCNWYDLNCYDRQLQWEGHVVYSGSSSPTLS